MASITLLCSVHSTLPAEKHRVDFVEDIDLYCTDHGRVRKKRADYGGITEISTDEFGMTVDYFCFVNLTPKESDRLTECVEEYVSDQGVPNRHQVHLIKNVDESDSSSFYHKRVYPTRQTNWKEVQPTSRVTTRANLPDRIKYLVEPASKYFLIHGGDDPAPCIGWDDEERDEYFTKLDDTEKQFLSSLYKQIVSKKDHEWIIDWYGDYEEGEGPQLTDEEEGAMSQAIYLIQFLHRLKQGGLLAKSRGKWKDISVFPELDKWYSDTF